MPTIRMLAVSAGAALSVAACGDVGRATAPDPSVAGASLGGPSLARASAADALADARQRLVPALEAAERAPMRDALAALDAALAASDAAGTRRALAATRALLARHDAADADAADVAAIGALLDAVAADGSDDARDGRAR